VGGGGATPSTDGLQRIKIRKQYLEKRGSTCVFITRWREARGTGNPFDPCRELGNKNLIELSTRSDKFACRPSRECKGGMNTIMTIVTNKKGLNRIMTAVKRSQSGLRGESGLLDVHIGHIRKKLIGKQAPWRGV